MSTTDLSFVALDLRLDGHLSDDELVALQPQVVQLLLAAVVVCKVNQLDLFINDVIILHMCSNFTCVQKTTKKCLHKKICVNFEV